MSPSQGPCAYSQLGHWKSSNCDEKGLGSCLVIHLYYKLFAVIVDLGMLESS